MRRLLPAVLPALLGAACQPATEKSTPETASASSTAALPAPEWTRNAVIYEINVRQYTPQGTFAALTPHLPRLDSLGLDILWLMPVQPIGVKNRKGKLGSYYSIRDYTAINPEFGTKADAKAFIDAAHQQGFKVILDWVANHSAHDHPWATQHPDWYIHRADGSISNALGPDGKETDWTDVAELNYGNAEMRRAMIGAMKWWVDSMGVDGFRADVAWGVPKDFWADVRRAITTARSDAFLLAEAEDPELHSSFHMTYGWELHHLMNEITQQKKPASELDVYFAKQDSTYPDGGFRMYFTSNHDENSWQGTEFERMGANNVPAYVLSATIKNSMPLLYTGQEVSLKKRLRFFEKDTVDWNGASTAAFYRRMFELKDANQALWNGAFGGDHVRLDTDTRDRVYAFTRTRGDNTVLVAVNFGDAPARVAYRGLAHPGEFSDWFAGSKLSLGAEGRLEIPAHGYRVLVR
jgi:glycosidase